MSLFRRLPRGGHPLGRQSYVEDVSTMQCQLSDVSSCHVFSLQLQLAGGSVPWMRLER